MVVVVMEVGGQKNLKRIFDLLGESERPDFIHPGIVKQSGGANQGRQHDNEKRSRSVISNGTVDRPGALGKRDGSGGG